MVTVFPSLALSLEFVACGLGTYIHNASMRYAVNSTAAKCRPLEHNLSSHIVSLQRRFQRRQRHARQHAHLVIRYCVLLKPSPLEACSVQEWLLIDPGLGLHRSSTVQASTGGVKNNYDLSANNMEGHKHKI